MISLILSTALGAYFNRLRGFVWTGIIGAVLAPLVLLGVQDVSLLTVLAFSLIGFGKGPVFLLAMTIREKMKGNRRYLGWALGEWFWGGYLFFMFDYLVAR